MKAKDLTGKKIGKLRLKERKRENNRTYYLCKCDCGSSLWIRADSLTKSNPTSSCGCENTKFKPKDIKYKRFGRLVAIEITDKRDRHNGSVIWKCKCDCGNIKYAAEYNLSLGGVSSCGCLGKENSQQNISKAVKVHLEKHIVEDTNIQVISNEKPMAHNTSGVTGVTWDKTRQKWKAEIEFKKKKYYLGRYIKKEDAIKARKEAEDKLHKEFLKNMKK